MRKHFAILAALALVVALSLTVACQNEPAPKADEAPAATTEAAAAVDMQNKVHRSSYAIGMDIGSKLKEQVIELNPDVLAQGIKDGYEGSTKMTEEEAQKALMELQQEMIAAQQERQQKLATENQEKGDAYLAENKAKEGVKTTPSGLQYEVLEEGDGPVPTANDVVKVEYTGTLIDGTVFDSTAERGEPAVFPVRGVIQGWQEALTMMPVGSKWKLVIPPALAYGDRQMGPTIGPNSVLVFEVKLLGIEEQPEAPAPGAAGAQPEAKPAQ